MKIFCDEVVPEANTFQVKVVLNANGNDAPVLEMVELSFN